MMKQFSILPNAYYNYLKDRNKAYREKKSNLLAVIKKTYHENNGTTGYRMISDLIDRKGLSISYPTSYKYMKELGLSAIINRKKMPYLKGEKHRVYDNLLNGNFHVSEPNKVWCTDFTYMQLAGGKKRYNCSIIDLFDRSVISTLNGKFIDAKLAIDTLNIGLNKHRPPGGLILHSDQGSQV
jgi:transposase InsO family protein